MVNIKQPLFLFFKMKKKDINLPKKKKTYREEDELPKPPKKKRYPEDKKMPHRFKPWQVNLEEEE
jgi:hypothetical protein